MSRRAPARSHPTWQMALLDFDGEGSAAVREDTHRLVKESARRSHWAQPGEQQEHWRRVAFGRWAAAHTGAAGADDQSSTELLG
jgi:hypothetical protein